MFTTQPFQRGGESGFAAAGERSPFRQDKADGTAHLGGAGICDVRMGDKRREQEEGFVRIGVRNALDKLMPAAFAAEQQLKARVYVVFGEGRLHETVIFKKTARGKKTLDGQIARERAR